MRVDELKPYPSREWPRIKKELLEDRYQATGRWGRVVDIRPCCRISCSTTWTIDILRYLNTLIGPIGGQTNPPEAPDSVAVFKALSDPFRLKILDLLPPTPDCEAVYNVNELVDELGGSQPNMSHHLKILKHAGVVSCKKMCNNVYFYKNPDGLKAARAYIDKTLNDEASKKGRE